MTLRLATSLTLLGIALGCSGTVETHDAGPVSANAAGANATGASFAGGSDDAGLPDDQTGAGAGGVAEQANENGGGSSGGVAAVRFWTEATQHIELVCFGFIAGEAMFRADRAELSVEQLQLLASHTGLPGSTYDDNDDAIHCVVTTTDAQNQQAQFTIEGRYSSLISDEPIFGEGGAAGDVVDDVQTVLGCEFRDQFTTGGRPIPANPLCVQSIAPDVGTTRFGLDLAIPGKPYHIELVHCTPKGLEGTTVELFGTDPATPIATGVTPDNPGRDRACLVFDVQVAAPIVGRLVFNSTVLGGPGISALTFR